MKASILRMMPRRADVALALSDDAQRADVRAELEALGHRVTEWQPGPPLSDVVTVLVVDGIAGVEAAREVPCHLLALVEIGEAQRLPESSRQVSDFLIKPLRRGEISTRVSFLAAKPSWREEVL